MSNRVAGDGVQLANEEEKNDLNQNKQSVLSRT